MRCIRRQAIILAIAACLFDSLPGSLRAQTAAVTLSDVVNALRAGSGADALRLSAELLRTEPRSEKAWALRAVAMERTGQPKEALAAYQHALTLAPDYLPALEGAAQISYKAQSPQAVPLLHHIVKVQPANATAHAMLAALEYKRADYASAAEDFAAASDAIRAQPDALMEYALCLAHLDRSADATATFQQLLALRPDDATARYDLAVMQWRSNRPADALATLQPLLETQTSDAKAMRLAAAIHEASNETPQAVELLRAAILAHPDDPDNYVDFATLSFVHGSYTVGVDMVNVGLARLPSSAALYMARGVLYGQNGDFTKAMADFEHAHQLDPKSSMAASAEGIAESQHQSHAEALQDFRRQVREHPQDSLAYYLLAEAISWAPPDSKQGTSASSLAEAIADAKKSIALDSHQLEAYDLLASLELQAGHADQAVVASHKALELNPKDQQAVYSLILALRKTGGKDELKQLVAKLTELRKADNAENSRQARYGQLVESPTR